MTSIDDAIREALDNPDPVVDVPDDFDPTALDKLDAEPDDPDAMELESSSDSSSSDSDMEDIDQELERLRKQISKPPKRSMPQRKRPPKRPPKRPRRQKTTPQRQKNKESAQRRRDDMKRYTEFLISIGKTPPNRKTIAAIREILKGIIRDNSGKIKNRAQELLADLNRKHPRRIKLRL